MNQRKQTGLTMIELAITLLIVAILVTAALTLYTFQVKRGRRADAVDSLSSMALAEERYRSANTSYGTLAQVWGGVTTSSGGFYTLSISNVSATSYTLTATSTGAQVGDTDSGTSCDSMVLAYSAGTITRTPAVCWPS